MAALSREQAARSGLDAVWEGRGLALPEKSQSGDGPTGSEKTRSGRMPGFQPTHKANKISVGIGSGEVLFRQARMETEVGHRLTDPPRCALREYAVIKPGRLGRAGLRPNFRR